MMALKIRPHLKRTAMRLCAVLLILSGLAGCQPTPLKPVVVNKSEGISAEMVTDPLPSGEIKEVDAPPHWKETMTRQKGRIELSADVDVKIPENLSNTPVYKLEQVALTPERLKELVNYFVGSSQLYKPLPMTKFEGMQQLDKLQDATTSYGNYDNDAKSNMSRALQQMIDDAPDKAQKQYTDLSFSLPYTTEYTRMLEAYLGRFTTPQAENYVDVFAQTGEVYEPEIHASTYDSTVGTSGLFKYSYPGSFYSEASMKITKQWNDFMYGSSFYKPTDSDKEYLTAYNRFDAQLSGAMDLITEDPDQALLTARHVLEDLGITDLGLSSIEKGVWLPRQPQEWDEFSTPIDQAVGGYVITFARSAGQLAGFRLDYVGLSAGDMLSYAPPFRVEQVSMFVNNGKVLSFDWRDMAQTVETIAQNTKLLPFDEIKERLADYLAYNFTYDKTDKRFEGYSVKFIITDAQLRSSLITAKDDPYKAWLVPAWLFRCQVIFSKDNQDDPSEADYPCEINALDGGIIIPLDANTIVSD